MTQTTDAADRRRAVVALTAPAADLYGKRVIRGASTWRGTADRVLCVGASHAFGGTTAALRALAGHVSPGGRLLFGDGFWAQPPSPEALGLFGGEAMPLPDLMEAGSECHEAATMLPGAWAYRPLACARNPACCLRAAIW